MVMLPKYPKDSNIERKKIWGEKVAANEPILVERCCEVLESFHVAPLLLFGALGDACKRRKREED